MLEEEGRKEKMILLLNMNMLARGVPMFSCLEKHLNMHKTLFEVRCMYLHVA